MSLDACADLVARADPQRFQSVIAAPQSARRVLLPIYAFNVEVSRAPWVTAEPMIAEMRLQWWRDVVEEIATGATVRSHEVAQPLGEVLDSTGAKILDVLIEARRWDIYDAPFENRAAFEAHLDATAGGLAWAAARALGAASEAEGIVRDAAWAHGLAAWLRAIPDYEARGRKPLVDGRPGAVQTLAREGLRRLERARRSRHGLAASARPALYAGWWSGAILYQAARDPAAVSEGRLGVSEFRRKAGLVWLGFTGRW